MATEYSLVALLPMKGHSERVPRKNFRPLAGKPLFSWILDTLLSIPAIELVIINTDARDQFEELGVDKLERVLIRDRHAEICGDFVSMNRVIADDVAAIPSAAYLMTHATNPLLGPATIAGAIDRFRSAAARGEADSLFTVNRFHSRFYDGAGRPLNHDPANLIRTQDLSPWFEENSNMYLFSRESFERTGARIGEAPLMYETPRAESIDIDDQEGWDMAEALAIAVQRVTA